MRSLLGPWMLAMALLASARMASAQAKPYPECTAEPTEGDVAAAKGAFQAGQASFNEADYARAITYWEDAYRRDCTAHALLLNLARAYELGGDKEQAVEALQTYLARKPESPQKDQINRRIEVLNRQLDREPIAAAAPRDEQAAPAPPSPEPEPPLDPEKAISVSTTEPRKDSRPKDRWMVPVILGAAGVVAASTGVVVHALGRSDEEEAVARCPSRSECDPLVEKRGNDGIFQQKVGVGMMVGGGVALGAGVVWYFLTQPASAGTTTPSDAAPPEPSSDKQPSGATSRPASPLRDDYVMLPDLGEGYAGLRVLGFF